MKYCKQLLFLFGALCCFITITNCLKILVVMPIPGPSHYLSFKPLIEKLAIRNHQVTFLSPFSTKTPIKNLEYFTILDTANNTVLKNNLQDKLAPMLSFLDMGLIFGNNSFTEFMSQFSGITVFAKKTCEGYLHSPRMYEFLSQERTYDLVIIEACHTNCFLGLVNIYKAPLILFSSGLTYLRYHAAMGLSNNPAYIPNTFGGISGKMDFMQRVLNTLLNMMQYFYFDYVQEPVNFEIAKKVFGYQLEEFQVIVEKASLFLVNTHHTIFGARPLVPGVIEIGGMHMGKNEVLPKNIEKWINGSKEGVIYFSMGSIIKGHTFPEEKRKIFLKAFGRLKQRVLWKWENETMPDKPDNVMIQKWMPQFDILCHPNVKVFIAHGGLLGTTEAVHCGVPVIMLPQFGDQHTNARALEVSDGGVVLDFWQVDEEMVYNALKAVLDPKFNKKAKELSARFRDRPMSPMDTAIYWIEYVARHNGAHHMRTAAVGMPLYQYLLLDVLAFLALCVLTVLFVGIYVTKFVCRKLARMLYEGRDKKKKVKKS